MSKTYCPQVEAIRSTNGLPLGAASLGLELSGCMDRTARGVLPAARLHVLGTTASGPLHL